MSKAKHLSAIEAELEELGEAPLSPAELEMLQTSSMGEASELVEDADGAELDPDGFDFGIDEQLGGLFAAEAARRFGRPIPLDESERISKLATYLAAQSDPGATGPGETSGAKVLSFPSQQPAAYLSVAVSVAAAVVLFWALRSESLSPAPSVASEPLSFDSVSSGAAMLGEQARRNLALLEQMDTKHRRSPRAAAELTLEARRSRWARLLAMRSPEAAPVAPAERERR